MEVANGSGPILHLNGSGRSSVEEQAILFTFRVILEGSRRSCDPLDDIDVGVAARGLGRIGVHDCRRQQHVRVVSGPVPGNGDDVTPCSTCSVVPMHRAGPCRGPKAQNKVV